MEKDCQAQLTEEMVKPITERGTWEARALWGRSAESSILGSVQNCFFGIGCESRADSLTPPRERWAGDVGVGGRCLRNNPRPAGGRGVPAGSSK